MCRWRYHQRARSTTSGDRRIGCRGACRKKRYFTGDDDVASTEWTSQTSLSLTTVYVASYETVFTGDEYLPVFVPM